jgi:hypothetical protein
MPRRRAAVIEVVVGRDALERAILGADRRGTADGHEGEHG